MKQNNYRKSVRFRQFCGVKLTNLTKLSDKNETKSANKINLE